jgi:uncharacterized protein with FMN-binding domain
VRRVILAILSTAAGLVLLLSFKTHASSGLISSTSPPNGTGTSPTKAPASTGSAGTSPGSGSGGSGTGSKSGTTGASSGSSATSSTAKTVAGDSVQTIYGPIQVDITVKGGKITNVSVPTYPNGTFRDVQINQFAVPQLIQETISAGSASINAVSGATYTSEGYISSLQSAIDKAGL